MYQDFIFKLLFLIIKGVGVLILLYLLLILLIIFLYKTKQKDRFERLLVKPKRLPLFIDFFRWMVVDMLRGKEYPVWGIYMFVAKPGNGKTISMTEHIVRVKKTHPNIKVYTNFNYKGQDGIISCWQDIVLASDNSIIAVDELHMLASSGSWQDFPIELLGEITQNRHSRKQFVTSTQDYDLVSVNFKRVCNYIVLCKNVWGVDRLFQNHYFDRGAYESKSFIANLKKCNFSRYFVASDETYARYNTLEKISAMVKTLDNGDRSGTIMKLKELQKSSELVAKEVKYIASIVERITNETLNIEARERQEHEIRDLKESLKRFEKVLT